MYLFTRSVFRKFDRLPYLGTWDMLSHEHSHSLSRQVDPNL